MRRITSRVEVPGGIFVAVVGREVWILGSAGSREGGWGLPMPRDYLAWLLGGHGRSKPFPDGTNNTARILAGAIQRFFIERRQIRIIGRWFLLSVEETLPRWLLLHATHPVQKPRDRLHEAHSVLAWSSIADAATRSLCSGARETRLAFLLISDQRRDWWTALPVPRRGPHPSRKQRFALRSLKRQQLHIGPFP